MQIRKKHLTRGIIQRTNNASMNVNGKRKMTTVELGKGLDMKLRRFARREDLTVSQVVRKAVRSYLDARKELTARAQG